MIELDLLQKASNDFHKFTHEKIEEIKNIHSGRQNTVFYILARSGERFISRYRTAKEFWYENDIKEKYLLQMGIKNIPDIVYVDDECKPQLLIYKYIEGDILHDCILEDNDSIKLAEIIASFHISANGASNFIDLVNKTSSLKSYREEFCESLSYEAKLCGLDPELRSKIVSKTASLIDSISSNDLVLLHNDLHFKNIVKNKNNELVIIDWDSAIVGPREKDFVKLLDWSHNNDKIVPDIINQYQKITGYNLKTELIEIFRIYAILRQIHFQRKAQECGVTEKTLEQGGFFLNNKKNEQRLHKALEKLNF